MEKIKNKSMVKLRIEVREKDLQKIVSLLKSKGVEILQSSKNQERKKEFKIMTKEQLDNFFTKCLETKHRCLFRFMSDCGLKLSEALNLKTEDLDLNSLLATIKDKNGELLRQVTIPPSSDLNRLMPHVIFEKQESDYIFTHCVWNKHILYKQRMVEMWFKKYLQLAELPSNFSPHSLRDFYASYLLDNSVPLEVVRDLLGHKTLSTTGRYIKTGIEGRKSQLNKLGFGIENDNKN